MNKYEIDETMTKMMTIATLNAICEVLFDKGICTKDQLLERAEKEIDIIKEKLVKDMLDDILGDNKPSKGDKPDPDELEAIVRRKFNIPDNAAVIISSNMNLEDFN
jgi:hypothetical protein